MTELPELWIGFPAHYMYTVGYALKHRLALTVILSDRGLMALNTNSEGITRMLLTSGAFLTGGWYSGRGRTTDIGCTVL